MASGGKKIVTVLVPFTKPQPKKVTYKIPERKWCCRGCGLGFPAVDGSFSQLATSEREATGTGGGLTTCPKAGCSRSEPWAQAPTTGAAADGQSCTHGPEARPRAEEPPGETRHLAETSTPHSRAAVSSHLYKQQCHREWQQPGPQRRLPGVILRAGADLLPQGSPLKSECPCWDKGGVEGKGEMGRKVHTTVYLAGKFGRLGFSQSPRFTVSEKPRRKRTQHPHSRKTELTRIRKTPNQSRVDTGSTVKKPR